MKVGPREQKVARLSASEANFVSRLQNASWVASIDTSVLVLPAYLEVPAIFYPCFVFEGGRVVGYRLRELLWLDDESLMSF